VLFLRYTPSDVLVRIILEKIQLFTKEELYLGKKAISILLHPFRKYLSRGKVIDDVNIPGLLKDC